MGYSGELRMKPREQQTSKSLKEKVVSLRTTRIRKSLEYYKVDNPLYVSQDHEPRRSVSEEPVVELDSSINPKKQLFKSMGNKEDDVVKYMRNLPGYLQRVENGENLQGKALNFGVLDWGRLENWKSNEKRIPPRYNMKTSLSSKDPALVESGSARLSKTSMNRTLLPKNDQQASSCTERLPPGVRWPRGNAVKIKNSETAPRQMLDGAQTPPWKDNSPGINQPETKLDRSKAEQADEMTISETETSSSDWRKKYVSRRSRRSSFAETILSEKDTDHANDPCDSGHHNVALFSPGDSPRSTSSHEIRLPESRKARDDKLRESGARRLSSCFSPEKLHSVNPFPEFPHSCPFPISAGTNHEPEYPYEIPVTPLKDRSLEENQPVVEHLTTVEAYKKFDLDIDEPPATKGRHSSPNRRFSFSLGKMTRSFSFKESSAIPQLSSTYTSVKSGPVNFEASPDSDICNRKNGYIGNRARSSPLRRLLDPLLKHKGAHSAENHKGNLNPASLDPLNKTNLVQGKNHQSLDVHALLQLTLKNGVPFFKLVVDNSSDILAAAVKKFPTSGKDDSSLTYAFYSVHEIKKKGGSWIKQGSKEKSCGFGYNMVGQMKISSSYHAEFSGPEKDLYVVRESVLYSTDIGQMDQRTPDCMLNSELAAIIVKNSTEEYGGDIGSSKSTVVILPGGIHSLPNSGQPSPLINRWRSGGSCDCGGWDIGCQLRILTNQDEMVKIPGDTMLRSTSNRLDLCCQGGYKNKHAFSLAPLQDGLYSLEYNASISLLQAFSVCVAVISSQKLTHIFQVNYLPEAEGFSKPTMSGYEKVKSQTIVHTKTPTRYVSKPPASPVGRV